MDPLQQHIEALIFCAESPVTEQDIANCLQELFEYEPESEQLQALLEAIRKRYAPEDFAFELVKRGGGYQFMTKPAYQRSVSIYLKHKAKKRLSASALETLAIVAYRQPVMKSEIEKIRGVGCDYAVQKLLEKGLLEVRGKAELPGRPVLYGTSEKFMEHLGINDLKELPELKDVVPPSDHEIGEALAAED